MGDYFLRLQALKNGTAKPEPPKETKRIAPVSEKKKAKDKAEKPQKDLLDLWFIERSKEMTGKCVNCRRPSTKGDPQYWKFSICHILPKALFPSVATHVLNFIELCFWDESCHSNFDNKGYEWTKEHMPKVWAIVVARFKAMYPSIARAERSKIPDILLQELDSSVLIASHDTELNTTLIEPA